MKKIFLLLLLSIAILSCTHKKDGWIVKGQDGRYYMLRDAFKDEAYHLEEIDSSKVSILFK